MSNRPSFKIEVLRGDLVECVHQVAACAVDRSGKTLFSAGDVESPVYLRSSAKPFIAAAVIAAGARERFGLEAREIAVMAASHSGQPFHVDAVRSILQKIGMTERDLQCGAHPPYNAQAAHALERSGIAAGPIYNNCSGKHAGILALCKILGADTSTYLAPENPVQQRILGFCARVSGVAMSELRIGVDGCGIPVYAIGLRHAALSFMRFATLTALEVHETLALSVVRSAMLAHPEYVAGTGELDTCLIEAACGSLACKSGAEGVHGVAALESGVGVVIKVLDGASRARGPATLSILRRLGLLNEAARSTLSEFERPVVYNRAGRAVGEIRAATFVSIPTANTG